MTTLQLGINLVLAILAYFLSSWVLATAGADGVLNVVVSLIVAVGVFFANFAGRLRA